MRWFASTTTTTTSLSGLNSPTEEDAKTLHSLLQHREGSMLWNDSEALDKYNTDWTKHFHGHSKIVLFPGSTAEVSSILRYCHERRIGVVPQAGNTGLVGGGVPIADEVILSTNKMNTIEGLDVTSGLLKCQAGCILQELQTYAAQQKFLIPVDLGAKGSCCIGGNVSTNAGGQYFYRYGSLHANVLGLEVVLADGHVLDFYSAINLKDNTGYHLKHLFIGAEGTLGIITKVALHCPRLPNARHAAFVACETFEDVLKTLAHAKDVLGEILAAFEFMDADVMRLIQRDKKVSITKDGDSDIYPYCVLIETHGSNSDHDMAKLEQFFETAMGTQAVVDGVLAQDLTQLHDLWEFRESAGPIVASTGYTYKYDVSIPIHEFADLIDEMRQRIQQKVPNTNAVNPNWGHVIDGNLHFNVATPGNFELDTDLKQAIEPFILESVVRRGGSISAEHGLGQFKNKYLSMCKDEAVVTTMRNMKHLFDPRGILNPGKLLP
jgi:FAD/FMN-containing dehydrogenase